MRPLIHEFDEGREYGQLRAPLKEFVDQSFARFVTGDLDINSWQSYDDWNTYLAQVEALKAGRFVEILQIAYDRMYR